MTEPAKPAVAAVEGEPLMEQLAEREHERWSRWMRHLFSKCHDCVDVENDAVDQLIPEKWALRWRRQMETPYAALSEAEKESDRKEAREILAVLRGAAPGAGTPEKEG